MSWRGRCGLRHLVMNWMLIQSDTVTHTHTDALRINSDNWISRDWVNKYYQLSTMFNIYTKYHPMLEYHHTGADHIVQIWRWDVLIVCCRQMLSVTTFNISHCSAGLAHMLEFASVAVSWDTGHLAPVIQPYQLYHPHPQLLDQRKHFYIYTNQHLGILGGETFYLL